MREIGAAKFKEQCLALLDTLASDGIIVTKHGRKVAKVIPYNNAPVELIGCMQDQIEVCGDLFTTGSTWDANDKP